MNASKRILHIGEGMYTDNYRVHINQNTFQSLHTAAEELKSVLIDKPVERFCLEVIS